MRGKKVDGRQVRPEDCTKCPHKCNENFNEQERHSIHRSYWEISELEKQRQYISSLVEDTDKALCRTKEKQSRRNKTLKFFLIKNCKRIQVCKGFFRGTLDISEMSIRTVLIKRNDNNIILPDKRGHHPPGVKKPEESRLYVKEHINSFPRVPSHYCQKDTSYEYLPGDLNISKMYKLYKIKCNEDGVTPEKSSYYRNVFHAEFKIKFHIPRKDMCDQCFRFSHLTDEEKEAQGELQKAHLNRNVLAKQMKEDIKEKASNNELNFIQFDLEAVRYCPSLNAKAIFYKRRLAVFNLTVYNTADRKALCYMWHEGELGEEAQMMSPHVYIRIWKLFKMVKILCWPLTLVEVKTGM